MTLGKHFEIVKGPVGERKNPHYEVNYECGNCATRLLKAWAFNNYLEERHVAYSICGECGTLNFFKDSDGSYISLNF